MGNAEEGQALLDNYIPCYAPNNVHVIDVAVADFLDLQKMGKAIEIAGQSKAS